MATLRAVPIRTVTLNNSVEYVLTNTYLKRERGMGKSKVQNGMQTASYCKTLCNELQASNCIYKLYCAPAKGIGPSPIWLEKLLTSILQG